MHHPTDRIVHITAFVTPVVDHWLGQEIAQWVHHEGSIERAVAPLDNVLTRKLLERGGSFKSIVNILNGTAILYITKPILYILKVFVLFLHSSEHLFVFFI